MRVQDGIVALMKVLRDAAAFEIKSLEWLRSAEMGSLKDVQRKRSQECCFDTPG